MRKGNRRKKTKLKYVVMRTKRKTSTNDDKYNLKNTLIE
jgi:hypothetical protein